MNRAEHLQWCKDHALEYVEWGEYSKAMSSMLSDLTKHPETHNPIGAEETIRLLLARPPITEQKIREWIEGFN
jgi:hypothetical protein